MFLQFIINGFIAGILYSLCAIGFALVYNITRIFHIAAAALYVIAAYSLYYAYNIMNMELPLAVFFAIVVTALFSLGSEWIVYRPLYKKKSSLNVVMISSIGLMTILVNAVAMFFGNETKVIDNSIQRTYNWEDVIITTPQMYQLVVGMAVIIVFMFFIRYSRLGIQFRALSSDDVLFKALGYRVNRVRNIIFLLSGVFIALASCLTVYDVGLDPHMGMNVLINAMVAMIIGGMGRFNACILGGLLLGILQSLVVYQFASNWQNAITFLVLLFFLFLRPQGIAGYKQRTV
ncbi:branched-chain amino acid ABC transporter permease [Phocaeicola sp.]